MAGFNGKWSLQDVNNAAAYCAAIGTPEEFQQKLRAVAEAVKTDPYAYIEEITINTENKTARRVVFINGVQKRDSGSIETGVEIDHPSNDHRPCKLKVSIDSETKITRYENGDGFSTISVAELSGDTMTLTCTSLYIESKMTMIFKRV